jgi:hypothetical protein
MKTKLITIIVLLLTSEALFGGGVFIGRIVSVFPDGKAAIMSVQPSRYQAVGEFPLPNTAVYLRGNFSGVIDGTRYKVIGSSIGNVQYPTAIGGMATVMGFEVQHLILIQEGQTNY